MKNYKFLFYSLILIIFIVVIKFKESITSYNPNLKKSDIVNTCWISNSKNNDSSSMVQIIFHENGTFTRKGKWIDATGSVDWLEEGQWSVLNNNIETRRSKKKLYSSSLMYSEKDYTSKDLENYELWGKILYSLTGNYIRC